MAESNIGTVVNGLIQGAKAKLGQARDYLREMLKEPEFPEYVMPEQKEPVDLTPYKGQWVALGNNGVLHSGESYGDVMRAYDPSYTGARKVLLVDELALDPDLISVPTVWESNR